MSKRLIDATSILLVSSKRHRYRGVNRLFVYSAVTLFDTTNTSIDTNSFGGAGSGVLGLVSFACGGPQFDSLGVSLLFLGRGPASSNNMVASNVTRYNCNVNVSSM
jgi:hypothetical protein